jgi:hypothetical protein
MKTTLPPTELSDNHRRSISTSLHLVDKELCQWEQWIERPPAPGVMYQQRDNLSARDKTDLRRRIAGLRADILRVRDDLQLHPAKPSTASLLVGQANVLWEMLAELNGSSLRGYGKVSSELAQYLDPIGESLSQQMYEISALFSKPTAKRKT